MGIIIGELFWKVQDRENWNIMIGNVYGEYGLTKKNINTQDQQ